MHRYSSRPLDPSTAKYIDDRISAHRTRDKSAPWWYDFPYIVLDKHPFRNYEAFGDDDFAMIRTEDFEVIFFPRHIRTATLDFLNFVLVLCTALVDRTSFTVSLENSDRQRDEVERCYKYLCRTDNLSDERAGVFNKLISDYLAA